jgi:hypothetical protein
MFWSLDCRKVKQHTLDCFWIDWLIRRGTGQAFDGGKRQNGSAKKAAEGTEK